MPTKSDGWSTKFSEPIQTPRSELASLGDARSHILKLTKNEQASPPWQTAARTLLHAAETGSTSLAEIAMKSAINGPIEQVFDPNVKKTNWSKRRKQDPWR